MAVITMYSLAVAPHISGFMSVLGSLWIVVDILRDRKKWHGSVYYRIMLGLSVTDIFGSFAKALGTWPIPVGTVRISIYYTFTPWNASSRTTRASDF